MYKFCVISLYMDMIWCFGRSLCFSRASAVLISPVLACVIGNTLRVRERHNSGRRIIQDIPSPRSYNRQECWIIKTQNPGLARASTGEQSVGKLLRSDTSSPWYNCHQMWGVSSVAESGLCWCQLNMRCVDIWSSDISEHNQPSEPDVCGK